MVNDSSQLYKVQKKDMRAACLVLSKAFLDDPVWIHVIPDRNDRKQKMPSVFEFVVRYSLAYGEVYAPTANLEGILAWVPSTTVEQSAWRILRSGAFIPALKMGREIGTKIEQLFKQVDIDRREHMKDRAYLYIQSIGVLPKFQGQGFGGRLLRSMFTRADVEGLPIYLETETEKNMQMYSKYGFQTLKEERMSGTDFTYWEMVREPGNVY